MKPNMLLPTALFALITPCALHAQGSLTPPPGPPAPVMKTLEQIYDMAESTDTRAEAIGVLVTQQGFQVTEIETKVGQMHTRTPISTLPGSGTAMHVISTPGHYYLTGDLTGVSGKSGIRVDAQNVVIDLNGFSLRGVGGCTKGIEVYATGPVVIRNGTLRFWPQQGIYLQNSPEFLLQDLAILNSQGRGVDINGSGSIQRVVVKNAVEVGIYCNGSTPSTISDCRVESIISTGTTAKGIFAPLSVVSRCTVTNITGSSSSTSVSEAVCGISASGGRVESCAIRGLTQLGGGKLLGIDRATHISGTTITQLSGAGALVAGIDAAKANISNCAVSTLSGSGAETIGIQADQGEVLGVTIDQITTTAGNAIGIAKAATVADATITNVTSSGVTGATTRGVSSAKHVRDCTLTGIQNSQFCVVIEADLVTDCALRDCGAGSSTCFGILATTVSQSTLTNVADIGIQVTGEASNNRITGADTGIKCQGNVQVNGNTIEGCQEWGIHAGPGYSTISRNNIRGIGEYGNDLAGGGILCADSSAYVEDNHVGACLDGFKFTSTYMGIGVAPITAFMRNVASACGFPFSSGIAVAGYGTVSTNPHINFQK